MSVPIKLRSIPLWGTRWSKDALVAKRGENERAYDRGFRMMAFSDEEATFPGWKGCYAHGVSIGDIQRNGWLKYTGVDPSGSTRPGNAIVTVAVEPGSRRRYPCDVRVGAWRSDELAEQIQDVNNLLNPQVIMVENNAYQSALIDWAQASKHNNDFWMKLEATTTGSNKNNQVLGLPGMQVEFSNGSWVVPHGEFEGHAVNCPCAWCRFDKEFRFHPLFASTDLVMATWFARQGIEMFSGIADHQRVGNLNSR